MFEGWKVRNVALAVLLAVVIPLSVLSSLVEFHFDRNRTLQAVDTKLHTAAVFAHDILGQGYHDNMTDAQSVSPDEFDRTVHRFNELCTSLQLEYLWSLLMVDGTPVFTSSTSPDKTVENQSHAKFFEPHTNPELYEQVFRSMEPEYRINKDKWGTIRVVLIPHYDAHGRKYLVGASIKQSDVEAMMPVVLRNSITKAIMFLIPGLIFCLLVSRWLTRPVSALAEAAAEIGAGNYTKKVSLRAAHEINIVADQLNAMSNAIQMHVESLEKTLRIQEHFRQSVNSSPTIFSRALIAEGFPLEFISDNIGVTGFSAGQLLAGEASWTDFIPQEDLERSAELIQEAIDNGRDTYKLEVRLKWADGDMHWYESWGRFIRDENGAPVYVQGFLIDITDEKQARDQLADQQLQLQLANRELENFHQIITASPVMIYIVKADEELTTEFISENYAVMGYDLEDLRSGAVKWKDLIHPEDQGQAERAIYEALESGSLNHTNVLRMAWASGEYHWYQAWNQIIVDEAGQPLYIRGVLTDITELKHVQEREAHHQRELDASVAEIQRLYSIVTSSPIIVYRLDFVPGKWPVNFISENVTMLGYAQSDLLSGKTSWYSINHPDDIPKAERVVREALEQNRDTFNLEARILTAAGEVRHMESWNRFNRDKEGNIIQIQGLFNDITDLKEAHDRDLKYQHRLKALAEDLIQVEDRERRQLAIALHDDIGQMLAALNMKLTVLKETSDRRRIDELVMQVDELLHRIMQTCKSLTWEISPTSLYETDIAAGIERMAADLKTYFGLDLNVVTAGERIEVDRELSALIFRCAKELLINSAKHAGTNKAEIGISQYENKVHLVVTDEGEGFDPSENGNGGSGFGLFSIRERIEHINGSMQIESEPGKGTRIMLIFPGNPKKPN